MAQSSFTLRSIGLLTVASLIGCGSPGKDSSSASTERTRNAALGATSGRIARPTAIALGRDFGVSIDDHGMIIGWGSYPGDYDESPVWSPVLRDGGTRFEKISAAYWSYAAIDDAGNLYTVGGPDSDGDYETPGSGRETVPELRDGGTEFTSVSVGDGCAMALDDLGHLYVFGSCNAFSYDESFTPIETPPLRGSATGFAQVAVSRRTHAALDDLGQIYVWGNDVVYDDRDAEGNPIEYSAPVLRGDGSRFVDISVSDEMVLAIDDVGQMYGIGQPFDPDEAEDEWLLEVPDLYPGSSRFTDVIAENYAFFAIDDLGRLYADGVLNNPAMDDMPELANGGSRFVSVATGQYYQAIALDDQGNLYGWGTEELGHFPDAYTRQVRSMPIAMGGTQAYAIADDGSLARFDATPDSTSGFPTQGRFRSVAAGSSHALAVRIDGTVAAWGNPSRQRTTVPRGLSQVVQVVAGLSYSAALRADGSVVEWGFHTAPDDSFRERDTGYVVAELAGGPTHILGLTREGGVFGWGDNTDDKASPPEEILRSDSVVSIAANTSCSAALKRDGTVTLWGSCPDSFWATSSVPGGTAIAMTEGAVIVLKGDGTITAWGNNVPAATAPEGNTFAAISAGSSAAMAVTSDGRVVTWGENGISPLTIPSGFSGAEPVAEDGACVEDQCSVSDDYLPAFDPAELLAHLSDSQIQQLVDALRAAFGEPTTTPVGPPASNAGPASPTSTTIVLGPDERIISARELRRLIDEASAEALASARASLRDTPAEGKLDAPAPLASLTAATVPESSQPFLAVGAKMSTGQAVAVIGLQKATKVAFVVPKKAGNCAVTKKTVTAKKPGLCTVGLTWQKKGAKKPKTLKATLDLIVR